MTQLIWNGVFIGAFYALVALGYSMVYGIIKLLNFAHGDIYMLGAFGGFAMLTAFGGGIVGGSIAALLVVLVLSMLGTGVFGVALERIAYRPVRTAPRLNALITAVGASFTIEYGTSLIAGPNPEVYPVQLSGSTLHVLDAHINIQQVVLVGIAIVLMVGMNLWVLRTRSGRAMRAISQDPKACLYMGVNVDRVISWAFFVGSALAGAAGVMAGAYFGTVNFLMGFIIGLKAFTAAVIGGIGNIPGAVLGGILLGLLESFGTAWLGGQWRDVFTFVVLILLLTVRPTGLLGERVTERV